nr:LppX_LprAFG lipoprotein [Mycobacterium sp.]
MVITGCGHKSSTATSSSASTPAASGTSASPAPTGPSDPKAQSLLQAAAKATGDLHAVHVQLTATNLPKLPMVSVNADVTNNQPESAGGQAVGDAKIRLSEKADPTEEHFEVTNKTMYTKKETGAYTSVGPAEKIYDPGIILDKDKGLGAVVAKVQSAQIAGNETINGVACVKVTGSIDSAVIDPVIPKLGDGGGALPITLWIADTTAGSATPNLVQFVVNKDQGNVQVVLSNWGKPITIPAITG